MNNDIYIQFPLFLMRTLFTDTRKTVEKMLWYGLTRFTEKKRRDLSDFISGSLTEVEKIAKEVKSQIEPGEPMPMVNIKHLCNFRDNDKSESDKAQLAAYIAIGSILGVKKSAKTNKQHIVARMFGYSSHKKMPNELNPDIKKLMLKYSNRYHIDKLLRELELNWHVVTYSLHMRGLYVGKEISIEMLALTAESRKQNVKTSKLKNEKVEARNKALRMIAQHLNKGGELNKEEL